MLSIPAVDTLQRVWKQDYLPLEKGGTWIADEDRLEAAKLYVSPYDLDASAAKKRSTSWIGYKVHFTETCDEDLPRLITQVTTTIAPTPDRQALAEVHPVLDQLHPDKTPDPLCAAAGGTLCVRSGSSARADRRVYSVICSTSWDRGRPCPGSPSHGLAAVAVYWGTSDPSSARCHRNRYECLPVA